MFLPPILFGLILTSQTRCFHRGELGYRWKIMDTYAFIFHSTPKAVSWIGLRVPLILTLLHFPWVLIKFDFSAGLCSRYFGSNFVNPLLLKFVTCKMYRKKKRPMQPCAAVVRLHLTLNGGLSVMGKTLWKQAAVKNLSFQLVDFTDFITAMTGGLVIRAVAQSPLSFLQAWKSWRVTWIPIAETLQLGSPPYQGLVAKPRQSGDSGLHWAVSV